MTILCCDTCTDYAVFAVANEMPGETTILAASAFRHERALSQRFYAVMDDVLTAAGVSFDEIDVLATGLGPGSFTGVRIAVTTFRTLAQVTGKRLVGVGTLDCYAAALAGIGAARLVPILPSRRGEVYAAVYDGSGQALRAPFVARHEDLVTLLQEIADDGDLLLCGQTDSLPPGLLPYPCHVQTAPPPEALARLAAEAVRAGHFADPLGLNPLYVAPPAISQHKQQLRSPPPDAGAGGSHPTPMFP